MNLDLLQSWLSTNQVKGWESLTEKNKRKVWEASHFHGILGYDDKDVDHFFRD